MKVIPEGQSVDVGQWQTPWGDAVAAVVWLTLNRQSVAGGASQGPSIKLTSNSVRSRGPGCGNVCSA